MTLLLAGCIVVPVGSNAVPGFSQHISDNSDENVLLISVLQTGRIRMSQLGIGGSGLRIERPTFLTERELASATLSHTKWGFCFGVGVRGGCGIAVNDRVIEACVIWPDGRVISFSSPGEAQWGRVIRGHLTDGWRMQLLADLPKSPVMYGNGDICPAQMSDLKWSEDERRRVIDFLEKVPNKLGINNGFVAIEPAVQP